MSRVFDPLEDEAPEAEAQENEARAATRPYSVRSWGDIRATDLPPRVTFWGDFFALQQVHVVIGQGGLGKTRIGMNLARNQVMGLSFAGMPTGDRPLMHLFMGSENSIYRLQYDIRRMSQVPEPMLALLSENIHLATIEQPDDGFISLGHESNVKRWAATLEAIRPDVLWVDPYGDVHSGDSNADADTRWTLNTLARLAREANGEAGIVILHHSRTGAANLAQATGFDAANFGKGSKALYSSARAVLNLAPGDDSENPPIVCVCAKNSNARRFEPFALTLDEGTMTYEPIPFDLDEWRDTIQAAARGKRSTIAAAPLEAYEPQVLDMLQDGPLPRGVLFDRVKLATGLGEKRIDRLLADYVHRGVLAKTPRLKERDGKVLYGTPEQVTAIKNPHLQGL